MLSYNQELKAIFIKSNRTELIRAQLAENANGGYDVEFQHLYQSGEEIIGAYCVQHFVNNSRFVMSLQQQERDGGGE